MTDDEQRDATTELRDERGSIRPDQRMTGPHRDAGHEVLRAGGTIAL
jgi:hypothetical protein